MRLSFVLVACAALPAHAQSAADNVRVADDACEVSMVRAPDDVRDVVDDALENEHCTTPLEVRIVRTEGGLYVFARDPRNRIRERIVADAQGAAVLIASWASDDGIAGSSAPAWATPPATEPAAATAPVHTLAPPGATLPTSATMDEPAPPLRRNYNRWLSVQLALGRGAGMRGTIDLWRRDATTIGITAAVTKSMFLTNDQYNGAGGYTPYITTVDARGLAHAAHMWGTGAWHLRASIGLGFVVTQASADIVANTFTDMTVSGTSVFPVAEAAAIVGVDLSDDWGLDVGLAPTLYAQSLHVTPEFTYDRSGLEWSLLGGLRHRL
jgi:hypothetical protein